MTIKDLKEKIMFLPDDMKVGGSGHYNEFLDCYDAEVRTVSTIHPGLKRYLEIIPQETIFCINIELPGEEPD